MGLLLTFAAAARRRLLRWPTRGVKVMVRDADGRLLLIRQSYGRTDLWVLPGGGIRWREQPIAAAAREVREEAGCTCTDLTPVGIYRSDQEGRRDTIHLFAATTRDAPVPDGFEVLEACFYPLDALPPTTSAAARRGRAGRLRHGPLVNRKPLR